MASEEAKQTHTLQDKKNQLEQLRQRCKAAFQTVVPSAENVRLVNESRDRFLVFCTESLALFEDVQDEQIAENLVKFVNTMERAKDHLGRALISGKLRTAKP